MVKILSCSDMMLEKYRRRFSPNLDRVGDKTSGVNKKCRHFIYQQQFGSCLVAHTKERITDEIKVLQHRALGSVLRANLNWKLHNLGSPACDGK